MGVFCSGLPWFWVCMYVLLHLGFGVFRVRLRVVTISLLFVMYSWVMDVLSLDVCGALCVCGCKVNYLLCVYYDCT